MKKKYAIIDKRMSEKCKSALINEEFSLIQINNNQNLDVPISAHPDIFVFNYKDIIISEPTTAQTIKKHLFDLGEERYKITFGNSFNKRTAYPYDCAYNLAVCGKYLIGNIEYADKGIRNLVESGELTVINTNQGYAKCNICIVNDNAIITEDKGIAKPCISAGIDVLLLNTNSVKLNGYKNGFIGGASGKHTDKLYFCGNIEKHPEYSKISQFCAKHGVMPISLSDEDLYDYGSIIIL